MTILKAGTTTNFQDKDGAVIKIGDRLKSVQDGTILTVDKFGRATSPLGFKYDLKDLTPISRGMNPDGTYFARITEYYITDERPPKPEGETVKPGNDADNLAPDRVKDTRQTAPKKNCKGMFKPRGAAPADPAEASAVANGVTVNEARLKLALADYQDEDLCDELRDRGYHGEITKTKTIKI